MTLTPEGYVPRLVDREIDMALRAFGAVCIEGPKWCGKTWAALNHSNSAIMIGDPNNGFQNRALVSANLGYAMEGDAPHLIDEWQDVPSIWDGVRFEVDRVPGEGRFILTGSSTPSFKGVAHGGAGRIGAIRMRTMSLFESGDSSGSVSLGGLFGSGLPPQAPRAESIENLIRLTLRGGWPRALRVDEAAAAMTVSGYLDASRRDAARLDGKARDSEKMLMMIRSLARNESTVASDQAIKRDMKAYEEETISDVTLAEYRDALSRIFLIEDQPPFDPNLRSSVRVGKSPKRHLSDPAIAAAALGLTGKMLLGDLRTYGFLFEAMCERDLQIYAGSNGGRLYHYRDAKGREIDAVVEMPDGRWGAFEIKLGMDGVDAAAESLLGMREMIESDPNARPPSVLCVVSGLAPCAYLRPDGVYVVPITSMRE
ncbi:MAG: DUF4143 domain-containing protein [Candidatus Methanoplasma sp.]|jgi:predicted AAA+ superfamily ATPase|nr:DUF4143 domain-containing protein [Candidatus Methanoplasma sp.]